MVAWFAKFNYEFAQNLAHNLPKQSKMKLYKKLHLFSLCLCLSWGLSVSSWDREIELKTMSLTTNLFWLRITSNTQDSVQPHF